MSQLDPELTPPITISLEKDLFYEWIKNYEDKNPESIDFKPYWAKHVPEVYRASENTDSLESSAADEQSILFDPLERFICGRNPKEVFEELKKLNETPSLCGKVFKSGEPTYSCQNCALDPTCVLCVDCFTNSEHKKHKYKMHASSGGGYCDCGDAEAFTSFYHCSNHNPKGQIDDDGMNKYDKLPIEVVERLRIVMNIVLNYSHKMLTWEPAMNLPPDLQYPHSVQNKTDLPDTYCTILYNDETHTYEQVIDTLTKAINCTKKVAINYATTIDREGRSIVKCSSFIHCNQVRHFIERVTSRLASKLKVQVMHTEVVAHQTFALKLLAWLQKIVDMNRGFCHVFATEVMEGKLLESIMLVDTELWKTARNMWHQLFISGILMDATCKKAFSRSFISVYPTILKEFIDDDHDHNISISSLGVQIFTVPTLAHFLIQEENAIAVVLRAFLVECERRHFNHSFKLFFQRNLNSHNFRRAQYMLWDLRYLVTVVPSQWNDQLRKSFCNGMQSVFALLSMMQDMGPVVRQVGQHVEFEAEWETGVNLQLRVADVVTLLLNWCNSDYKVFIKTLRANIKHYQSTQPKTNFIGVELGDHSANCIQYDVASEPISIYLPLVRFMAGLLLHLEKFNLSYKDPQISMDSVERPCPEQLMELPLRTLVMLAQFRAGMWRRNGYSLLNQVYFYQNVRLREEMFDRDILMLQIAASMIESNEFLIHLIYKYGLLNWADESWKGINRKPEEDNIRQILTVAEEFLSLILTIVSERFVPGLGNITEIQKIKKEIIQLLCIEPMPHSQLIKLLPKDPDVEIAVEDAINEVATLKMPQGLGVGKYELKAEFFKCFNPFYFHYTREEQSKAEEAQMKRKKLSSEDACCPPPVPPEFCPRYQIIVNILQCDVMLHIMHVVLERTLNLFSAAFSETQLEKVLHLIGVALHEEERLTKASSEASFFCFTSKASKLGFVNLLEECLKSPRVERCGETQKDLLTWVISKFKYVEGLGTQSTGEMKEMGDTAGSASSSKNTARDRKRKTEMAAARRTRIMAQMSAMQRSFIKEHAEMFAETILEDSSKSDMDISEVETEDQICFFKDSSWKPPPVKIYTCILCREDQTLSGTGRTLVLSAFVQKSTILSKNRKRQLTDTQNYDPFLMPADMYWSVHTSTCGHVMHSDCWQKFFDSVVHKEQRRPVRFGRHTSFDVEKKEFLCPLCERLSNTVLPIVPPLSLSVPLLVHSKENVLSVDDFLSAMKRACEEHFIKVDLPNAAPDKSSEFLPFRYKLKDNHGKPGDDLMKKFKLLFSSFDISDPQGSKGHYSSNLLDMMVLFSEAVYSVAFNIINISDVRSTSMAWSTCAYTVHAMEWLLRDKKKALFKTHSSRNALCLETIIRYCGASLFVLDHSIIRTNCIRMLRYLLIGDHYLSSPQCCLDHDAFTILVFLVLSMPALYSTEAHNVNRLQYPLGTNLDKYLLHMMLVFHFVQVLLTYPFHEEETMDTEPLPAEELADHSTKHHGENVTALLFYEEVRTAAGFDQFTPAPSGHTIVQRLKSGSLPFLRCAAVFFHVLTDTPPPASLQELNDHEFDAICKFLGLPTTLDELLASTSMKHLALSWARHPRTLHLLLNPDQYDRAGLVRHPVSINRLVTLPYDYSDLYNSVSQFRCPNFEGDDSRNPTMCLVCGTIVCSQSYCCQIELKNSLVGACTSHAHNCGSGIGIFLRIKDCKVLLLSDKNKGCFTAPPYVDEYGETDQGLFRGNPLHLCCERYEELHELWLSHNIPEKVSHKMDQSTSLPNWQLL